MATNGNPFPNSQETRQRLAVIRQRNGLSLEQIADSTKISSRFLRAIEAEQYDKLPGGILSRSYLRQYAAAIGFDEDELLSWYYECTGDRPEVRRPSDRPQPDRRSAWGWFRSLSAIRFF